jgi:hypothetical protein
MEIFIVLIEERHSDPFVRVFDTEESANNYANVAITKFFRHPEDAREVNLQEDAIKRGLLRIVQFEDSGNIYVRRSTLNDQT